MESRNCGEAVLARGKGRVKAAADEGRAILQRESGSKKYMGSLIHLPPVFLVACARYMMYTVKFC